MNRPILLLVLGLLCSGVRAQVTGLDQKDIRHLRSLLKTDSGVRRQYETLARIADTALDEDPNPIDTIRSEGLLQGDPRKTATQAALRDMRKMYALSVVSAPGR